MKKERQVLDTASEEIEVNEKKTRISKIIKILYTYNFYKNR